MSTGPDEGRLLEENELDVSAVRDYPQGQALGKEQPGAVLQQSAHSQENIAFHGNTQRMNQEHRQIFRVCPGVYHTGKIYRGLVIYFFLE